MIMLITIAFTVLDILSLWFLIFSYLNGPNKKCNLPNVENRSSEKPNMVNSVARNSECGSQTCVRFFFFFCMHDYVYRIKAHKVLLHELHLATEWTRRSSDRLYPISEGKESQLTEKQQCRLTNFQEYTNGTTPNKHKVKPEKT